MFNTSSDICSRINCRVLYTVKCTEKSTIVEQEDYCCRYRWLQNAYMFVIRKGFATWLGHEELLCISRRYSLILGKSFENTFRCTVRNTTVMFEWEFSNRTFGTASHRGPNWNGKVHHRTDNGEQYRGYFNTPRRTNHLYYRAFGADFHHGYDGLDFVPHDPVCTACSYGVNEAVEHLLLRCSGRTAPRRKYILRTDTLDIFGPFS